MSKKRISNLPLLFCSVIIGVFVVLIALIDHYAIKAGQLGDGIGFFSLFYISPIGLIFGLMGLKNKKNRHVALLGIGINLSAVLFCVLILTVFYTP
ncbi:hypothetical protein [Paenibacillus donghaensis]|uniref:Uncharacterized protein n=1 Tax=Paenibacillus donghaensis TaxID=414771 RepID=A0A2Z2K690_9BACL|nr:hypothetical protein [Paenibacillus donghaensis]ASA20247.1 hypothetical protein B9T62_05190 [Paenibacillus donghaensis]